MELTKEKIKSAKNIFNIDKTDVILYIITIIFPMIAPVSVCMSYMFVEGASYKTDNYVIALIIIYLSVLLPTVTYLIAMYRGGCKENKLFDIKREKNIDNNEIEKYIKENNLEIIYMSEATKMFFDCWLPCIAMFVCLIAAVIVVPNKELNSHFEVHPEGPIMFAIILYIIAAIIPTAVHYTVRRHEWHDRFEILKYYEPNSNYKINTHIRFYKR